MERLLAVRSPAQINISGFYNYDSLDRELTANQGADRIRSGRVRERTDVSSYFDTGRLEAMGRSRISGRLKTTDRPVRVVNVDDRSDC